MLQFSTLLREWNAENGKLGFMMSILYGSIWTLDLRCCNSAHFYTNKMHAGNAKLGFTLLIHLIWGFAIQHTAPQEWNACREWKIRVCNEGGRRYEDYLDSQITPTDLFYLEDLELARQLVEMGCTFNPLHPSTPSSPILLDILIANESWCQCTINFPYSFTCAGWASNWPLKNSVYFHNNNLDWLVWMWGFHELYIQSIQILT